MSRENVELVRSAHPLSGTELTKLLGDDPELQDRLDVLAPLFHSDFAFSGATIGGTGNPEEGTGFPRLAVVWREWMEPWEAYWTEVEEILDIGGDRVVVKVRDRGRLRGGDQEVVQLGASIWTIKSGKVARIDFYLDRDLALEAAGLRE